MKFGLFLREQWRFVLFYLIAVALLLAVLSLDAVTAHMQGADLDLPYAGGLALFVLVLYLGVEYGVRLPFYREATARLRQGGSGDISEASTFTTAVTAEQKLFLQLLHLYHKHYAQELHLLEKKREFYERFVTLFAHQMKTPLTVIQLLEDELQGLAGELQNPRLGEILRSLAEERSKLDGGLDTMLYTARLDAFAFDASMERVELLALLRSVVNEHKTEWIHHGLFPKLEADAKRVEVHSDRKWLRFVCDQIVRNALQYGSRTNQSENGEMEAKKRTNSFVIRVETLTDAVCVSFHDQGIGIPARDLPHVFEPFYTGANGRMHSRSTGMGLYLVKQVTQQLGHQVQIESVAGQGTTVTLSIAHSDYYQVAANLTNL